jgi:peptide/nickel transport system permease protein
MTETIRRVVTYTVYRVVALALTVVVGVYLAILIANMGGYVDQIRKAQIDEAIGASVLGGSLPAKASPKRAAPHH